MNEAKNEKIFYSVEENILSDNKIVFTQNTY